MNAVASITELLQAAIAAYAAQPDDDDFACDRWTMEYVWPLTKEPWVEETYDAVVPLCESNVVDERAVAAEILRALAHRARKAAGIAQATASPADDGSSEPAVPAGRETIDGTWAQRYLAETFPRLSAMLAVETETCVIAAILPALGELYEPRALDIMLPYRGHASAAVRLMVACWLPSCFAESPDARGVQALIELMHDRDDDVRDWATFELGMRPEIDDEAVRDAFLQRITDVHEPVRSEALAGLARRSDVRVVEPLLAKLQSGSVGRDDIEAAEEIGDPRLLPALIELRAWWPGDNKYDLEALERAVERCSGTPAPASPTV